MAPALAQEEQDGGVEFARPEGAQRLVALWDFEDALRHLEEVPQHWYRGHHRPPDRERPGFPPYNLGVFDRTIADGGDVSMQLPTRGGSTSLMLAKGVIAALPEGDYVVVSRARTEGLEYAGARIAAWFLDAQLEEIPGTRQISDPVRTLGDWETISVELGGRADAAWIQIELQLVQPREFLDGEILVAAANKQDFSGAVWFDDVAILLVPRLEISTGAQANVHVSEEPPQLRIIAQDLTGEELDAQLRVTDLTGRLIDEHTFRLQPSGRSAQWRPNLSEFGWYRAELQVVNADTRVWRTESTFIWSPPESPLEHDERLRYGVVLSELPEDRDRERDLLGLIRRLDVGRVNLPVWDNSITYRTVGAQLDRVGGVAERLIERGIELTFTLESIPTELATQLHLDETQFFDLFLDDREPWAPYLDRLLAVFGERVRRWQVGPITSTTAFYRTDLEQGIETITASLLKLVPRPIVALPWRIDQRLDGRAAALQAATLVMPSYAPDAGITQWAQQWPDGTEITLVVEPQDYLNQTGEGGVIAMSKKLIAAHKAGVDRITTPELWRVLGDSETEIAPMPELAMWITLVHKLAGREILGEMPMPDGSVALIADGHRGGMLIAWNDYAPRDRAVLQGYLAEGGVTVTDLFGNSAYVSPERGEHRIELSQAPVFIEGIDVELALMRSRLRIEPGFISSRATRHQMELVVFNPWSVNLSGRLKIADPEDWTVSPRVQSFTVGPGQERRMPFELGFGIAEETGMHQVMLEFRMSAERRYPTMRMPVEVEIGLDTVWFSADARLEDGEDGPLSDVIVTIFVQNIADVPQTMQVFVQAPGHAMERSPVSELEPGQSEIRHFRLIGGGLNGSGQSLVGRQVRVGLKEQDGTGRLNESITVR